jgi:hypothetical protein
MTLKETMPRMVMARMMEEVRRRMTRVSVFILTSRAGT